MTTMKSTFRCCKCDYVFDKVFYEIDRPHIPKPLECPKCHSIDLEENVDARVYYE